MPIAVCALVAAVVAITAQLAAHPEPFHPSQLLSVSDADPIAQLITRVDPSFRLTVASDHYDGVYFLAMALDPFALGEAHDLIDLAAYRYGHPLWGWLAALLSFGRPAALAGVFWFMSVASMAFAAAASAVVARRAGASPWIGLAVAASPGLLFSATTALTEPFQVALICAMLLAWQADRHRLWRLALISAALCLTKEQLLLVPAALALLELARIFARDRVRWRSLIALAAGPFTLGAWLLYIRGRFSEGQSTYDDGNIGTPVLGWLKTFDLANNLRLGESDASQIGSTVVPGLLATAVVLIVATIVGLRRRGPLGFVVALQTLLNSTLGWRTLLYPHEMFRIPSVALALAVLLLAIHLSASRRATIQAPVG